MWNHFSSELRAQIHWFGIVYSRDVNRAAHRMYAVRFWNILPRPNRAAWVINFCPRVSAA